MKEILVLSPTPSHPQDQGNRKLIHASTLDFQERGARIHFLYVPTEWSNGLIPDEYVDMADQWDLFHVIPPKSQPQFWTNNDIFMIDDLWDADTETVLKWWQKQTKFDAVICHYVFMSKALEFFPDSTYKILYTIDRFSDRKEMLLQNGLKPEYFYTNKQEEAKAFNRADIVIAVKDEEADYFKTITDTQVVTIGHLDKQIKLTTKLGSHKNLRIGFIGSENSINTTNLDNFFSRHLASLEACKDIKFKIAGKICDVWSIESPIVELVGRVETVKEFYEEVDLIIIPFEFSTGIKIKAIEAMAHGVGVLMTKNACEGIPSDFTEHTYNDIDAIYEGLIEMINDRNLVHDLAKKSNIVYTKIQDEIARGIDQILESISTNNK